MPCHTGAFSAGDTLVPIPNTKVKTRCGDDTPLGESSTVPDYSKTCLKRQVFGVKRGWSTTVWGCYNGYGLIYS